MSKHPRSPIDDFLQRARLAGERIAVIAPEQVGALQKAGATLLDVREPDEYAAAHLPGAVSVPRDGLVARVHLLGLASDIQLICYCRSGYSAALAADELQTHGYSRVCAVAGGLNAFPPHTELWSDYEI